MASWIKMVLISTGFVAVAMHLKAIVPVAVDFSRIRFYSVLTWLKPPYLYVIINVIIIVIGVSSWYCRIIANNNGKDGEVSYSSDDKFQIDHHHNIHRAPLTRRVNKDTESGFVAGNPPSIMVKKLEVVREVVYEEKGGLAEAAATATVEEKKMSLAVVVVAKSENLSPVEKPLVTARIGHRKLVKTTPAEKNVLRALRVAKPRRNETLENTWKLITERKSTPLTSYYRRPDTFGVGEAKESALKKSESFKDRSKYYLSPAVSRSRDELNVKVEAFIKKCNEERFESMRLDKEVARHGLSF